MKLRGVFWAGLAVLTFACGPQKKIEPVIDGGSDGGGQVLDSGHEGDAGPSVDAGMDAGPGTDAGSDAGSQPGVDAGPVDGGAACDRTTDCVIKWTEPDAFSAAVDHHTVFIHSADAGTFLYVVGGVSNLGETVSAIYDTVRRAKIKPDGSLEPWTAIGSLPAPRGFHTQAKLGNHVYILGGVSGTVAVPYATATVLMGTLDDDGLITWKRGADIGSAVLHGTAAILGDKLYLMGGSANAPKADVVVSTLGADGLNGPWTAGPPLPVARSHHTAVVHNGQIFLMGGFDANNEPLTPILRSTLDSSGAVTAWGMGGELVNSPWTSGATVWGDSVFLIGGGEGGPGLEHFVDRVQRGRFFPNNTLDTFVDVTSLPVARSHVHFAPIFDGRIYSVGGRLMPAFNSMDRVFIGTFQP